MTETKTPTCERSDELISFFYGVNNFQSIGEIPRLVKSSFVFEKCLQPKKPLSAEKGEGCAAFKT